MRTFYTIFATLKSNIISKEKVKTLYFMGVTSGTC